MFSRNNLTILFLMTALVIFSIFIWPEYQRIKSLETKIEEINYQIKNQEDYLSYLKDIDKKIKEEYSVKISLIDYALPEDPNLPLLYDFMFKTCSQNGLILTSISNDVSEPKDEETGKTSLGLELSGTYSSFKDFISALENSARIFEIESISFSSPEEKDLPFDFNLKTMTNFIK